MPTKKTTKKEIVEIMTKKLKYMSTKKTTEDWEKEFGIEFGSFECLYEKRKSRKGDWILFNDLKSFISKTRKQAVISALKKIKLRKLGGENPLRKAHDKAIEDLEQIKKKIIKEL